MSHPVPQQQSAPDAARGDVPSVSPADRPLPDFPQHGAHSPIDREIERSERASAALAATRALARASFTDSQLAADDAGDIDSAGWIRTEYAALDHSVRTPQEDVPHAGMPLNLVGGSFNPGIASQHARSFLGASLAQAPIKTRSGAQARFMHEARLTPRAERVPTGTTRTDLSLSAGTAHYDKPAVMPMLATPAAAPGTRSVRANVPTLTRARIHQPPSEPFKFALSAGLGAVIMLMGGGVAWKAGWLSHPTPSNASLITPQVAAQAEAARVLSSSQQEIPIATAAGTPTTRTNAEVDAALAAAARAAAVPVASVQAAGPARVARPLDLPAFAPEAARVAATTSPSVTTARTLPSAPTTPLQKSAPAPHGKDSVSAAIANAQARADSFLASGRGVNAAPASPEVKPTEQ
ncbi:MAG: hypothetical protein ABIR54_22250 [Burkholderiaceae bacterium]